MRRHSIPLRKKKSFPIFLHSCREQEKVSGAVRGNAFHRTMELLDFTYLFTESGLFTGCPNNYEEYRRGLDKNRLQNRLEEFLQRETVSLRLTEEYAKAVSLPKILNFLERAGIPHVACAGAGASIQRAALCAGH